MSKKLLSSRKFHLVFAGLLAAWLVAAPLAAKSLIARKAIEKPDAILVLAGSAVYKERNEHAAALFRQGISPRIIITDDDRVSGWSAEEGANMKYAELARRELTANGVPADRITVLEEPVSGTVFEARLLADRARSLGLKNVLLVTSAYHSARALRTFERVSKNAENSLEFGIDPVDPGIETPSELTWWLSVRGWRFVGGEFVKSVYYWLIV